MLSTFKNYNEALPLLQKSWSWHKNEFIGREYAKTLYEIGETETIRDFLPDYIQLLRGELTTKNSKLEIFPELQPQIDKGRCYMLAGSLASKAKMFDLVNER